MTLRRNDAPPDREPAPTKPAKTRVGFAAAVIAVAIVAFVASAMVFAVASGTDDAADQGEVAVLSEAALSAAAAARNGIVQAQVIAEANQLGLATNEELNRSINQAEGATTELVRRMERLLGTMDDDDRVAALRRGSNQMVDVSGQGVALLRSGDLAGSGELISVQLDESYLMLAGQLAANRDTAMARLALAGEDAGRIADAARFLVVLLVPLAVLVAYRRRVRREQQQRDLEHQLEKQQAVSQAQDEFIANLSHELRTPLTAIYGFSLELIEPARHTDPTFDRELATYIASESAELSRMVEDILAAASADQDGLSITLAAVDPVRETESVLGPMRATGAQIESDLTAAEITADPLRFRQIVRNLLSNALRHGGPNNLVSGRIDNESYVLEVRDDGDGIPRDLEDRLFTRFIHKGDEPLLTGSVGLGLAIVHLLTTRTGGQIAYRREKGETVFSVTYPLAPSFSPGRLPVLRRPAISAGASGPTSAPEQKPDLKNFTPHPTRVDHG